MLCAVCKECKLDALNYGRGERISKGIGDVVRADLGYRIRTSQESTTSKCSRPEEATRDQWVTGRKTRNVVTDVTTACTNETTHDGVGVQCIGSDGAGELGRSVKFRSMPVVPGVELRKSTLMTPPRATGSLNGLLIS